MSHAPFLPGGNVIHLLSLLACTRLSAPEVALADPGPASPYVVVKLGRGPDYVPGVSEDIAALIGVCGTAVLAAQEEAWAAQRSASDHNGANCSVDQAGAWIRDRLAEAAREGAANRPDRVAVRVGEAVEAVQAVMFDSNLVETLAQTRTVDELDAEAVAFWRPGYAPKPTSLLSQYRATSSPDRCGGVRPELAKRTPGSGVAISRWGLSGHAAAVRVATEATLAVVREAAKAAPGWASGCESYVVTRLRTESPE